MHIISSIKEIAGVILHKLELSLLLEKVGGIPHPERQMNKVLSSKEVYLEELLVNISKSKKGIFLCTPLEVKRHTPFQEVVDSSNHKEWTDAMRNERDSTIKNKV